MEPINVAVIGVGKMGLSHLSILQGLDDYQVTTVIDNARIVCRTLKSIISRTDLTIEAVAADSNIEAAVIATPTSTHYQIAETMLNAGKHVFLEKPLTGSGATSSSLLQLARERQRVLQPGYVNTFNPVFQLARSLMDNKAIGDPRRIESHMRGSVVTSAAMTGWRTDAQQGGGALLDYGSHALDLLLYFCGNDVVLQTSDLTPVFSSKAEDVAYLSILHSSGVSGLMHVDWSDPTVRKAENTVSVTGTGGKLVVTKQELRIYVKKNMPSFGLKKGWNQKYITDTDTQVPFYLRGEDFTNQLIEFSRAIRAADESWVDRAERACLVDRLIEDAKSKEVL